MALLSSRGEKKKAMEYEFEFDLPEEIIQLIQYFLGGTIDCLNSLNRTKHMCIQDITMVKQAAQTSLLSKSWYSAWSTRPVLILSNDFFPTADEFLGFARGTIQKYKNLNRSIHSLVLVISDSYNGDQDRELVDELIADSLSLGLNELHVSIYSRHPRFYYLPVQVLETKTLTKLCVDSCHINAGRVLCSRLASLYLFRLRLAGGVLTDIFLACTSIQNLALNELNAPLDGPDTVNLSKLQNLVHLSIYGNMGAFDHVKFMDPGSGINGPQYQYRNLNSMELECWTIDASFFTQFSSLFPCVENLQLYNIGHQYIHISSQSVKFLELLHGPHLKKVRLEVPNIRKLIFVVGCITCIPSLSLSTTSKDWESHVELRSCTDDERVNIGVSKLKNLFMELSESKIFVSLNPVDYSIVLEGDVSSLATPPVVENFNIESLFRVNGGSLLGDLLICSRPRFITFDRRGSDDSTLLQLISDTLIFHNKAKYNINQQNLPMELINPVQSLFLMYGLEEVKVELFDRYLEVWRTIPSENFVDSSSIQESMYFKVQKIRLHFTWGGV